MGEDDFGRIAYEALELAEELIGYAGAYFREKYGYDEDLRGLRERYQELASETDD